MLRLKFTLPHFGPVDTGVMKKIHDIIPSLFGAQVWYAIDDKSVVSLLKELAHYLFFLHIFPVVKHCFK